MALFAAFDATNVCNSFLISTILFLKKRKNIWDSSFSGASSFEKGGVLLNFSYPEQVTHNAIRYKYTLLGKAQSVTFQPQQPPSNGCSGLLFAI